MDPFKLMAAWALEIGALAALLQSDSSLAVLMGVLSGHAGASALFALGVYPWLPARMRVPRLPVLALLFVLCFFVPLLGIVSLLLALLAMRLMPLAALRSPWLAPQLPEPLRAEAGGERRLREASLRPLLADTAAAAPMRSRALNALATMPLRTGSDLLRRLLADPVEDLRLLSYGILDSNEKLLRQRVDQQQQRHADAVGSSDEGARVGALRALAELHFDLAYQGLVQGDLRRHALGQALQYVQQALDVQPDRPGLYHLRARVHLALDAPGPARVDFERAIALGLPASRVGPQLAELAFRNRDWAGVRAAMQAVPPLVAAPRIAGLARFWSRPGPPP